MYGYPWIIHGYQTERRGSTLITFLDLSLALIALSELVLSVHSSLLCTDHRTDGAAERLKLNGRTPKP